MILKFNEFLFENKIDNIKKIDISDLELKHIEGGFLTKKEAKTLQKEIEANYSNDILAKNDIRNLVHNYDNPIAEKDINGINLRIVTGLIRDGKRTYLLYADKEIIGEFYSISDIKAIIKHIENNLIKTIH